MEKFSHVNLFCYNAKLRQKNENKPNVEFISPKRVSFYIIYIIRCVVSKRNFILKKKMILFVG